MPEVSSLPATKDVPGRTEPSGASSFVSVLVAVAIATSLLDRVDLFGGSGPFVLTPFLLIAPVVVATAANEFLSAGQEFYSVRRRRCVQFSLLLMFSVIVSRFVASGGTGDARAALLLVLVVSAIALAYLVRRRRCFTAVRFGALAALLLYVGFDFYQLFIFQTYGITGPSYLGIVNVTLSPYGEGVVRFTGGAADANRAAMAISIYTYLFVADPAASRSTPRQYDVAVLLLGFVLCAFTLSRSGLLIFALVLMAAMVRIVRHQSTGQRALTAVGLTSAFIYAQGSQLVSGFNVGSLAASRFDLSEASAQSHFELIDRGLSLASEDWHLVTGRGYGDSYLLLGDYFSGDFGNFHSLYVTALVEIGLLGFVAITALVVGPALFRGRRALAIGIALFNVFYQSGSDPIFWIAVVAMWVWPTGRLEPEDGASEQIPELQSTRTHAV